MKQNILVHHSKFKAQTLGIAVIALAASLAPLPSTEASGKGVAAGVLANFIYDALTGNKVPVTPPMDGKITAKPKVEAFGGSRMTQTVNGYAHSELTPDRDRERNRGYNDDKWTEYFNVSYNEVVDNPDYDPDAEPGEANSRKYILGDWGNDYGDDYMSTSKMEKEYATAEKGWRSDDNGREWTEFTKEGRWVYTGESERIKCNHRLLNEVTVGDNRLAKKQTYKVEVRYQLDYLTWSKEEEDFIVKIFDDWQNQEHTLSATSSGWKKIKILKKNTRIYQLEEKGSSRIWWKGRAFKPLLAKNYIVWDREQHDELNSK